MTKINPEIAKRLRQRQRLTLEAVQERSGINKSTIHRIETGGTKSTRRHVIEKLAGVLNTTPEILTSESVQAIEDAEDSTLFKHSQLNVRIPDSIRNALTLVARRYSIQPLDIIEIAPLLFHLTAEESLKEREERLAALRSARKAVEGLRDRFPHISERLVNDWDAEGLESAEERSISQRDLRGATLDECLGVDPRPLEYESDVQNPLVTHLRDRLKAVGSQGELSYWHEALSPRYEICHDEALAYCGDDEDAAHAIVYGVVGLHDLPKELVAFEHVEKRNAWIAERRRADLESFGDLVGLSMPIGDPS